MDTRPSNPGAFIGNDDWSNSSDQASGTVNIIIIVVIIIILFIMLSLPPKHSHI